MGLRAGQTGRAGTSSGDLRVSFAAGPIRPGHQATPRCARKQSNAPGARKEASCFRSPSESTQSWEEDAFMQGQSSEGGAGREASAEVPELPEYVWCEMHVSCSSLAADDTVLVVGGAKELGGWNVGKAVALHCEPGQPWKAKLMMKLERQALRTTREFKFVVKRANGQILLEDGPRRVLPTLIAGHPVLVECQAKWHLLTAGKLRAQARQQLRSPSPAPARMHAATAAASAAVAAAATPAAASAAPSAAEAAVPAAAVAAADPDAATVSPAPMPAAAPPAPAPSPVATAVTTETPNGMLDALRNAFSAFQQMTRERNDRSPSPPKAGRNNTVAQPATQSGTPSLPALASVTPTTMSGDAPGSNSSPSRQRPTSMATPTPARAETRQAVNNIVPAPARLNAIPVVPVTAQAVAHANVATAKALAFAPAGAAAAPMASDSPASKPLPAGPTVFPVSLGTPASEPAHGKASAPAAKPSNPGSLIAESAASFAVPQAAPIAREQPAAAPAEAVPVAAATATDAPVAEVASPEPSGVSLTVPPEQRDLSPASLAAEVALTIVVPKFACAPGSQLVLCGASKALGKWQPHKGLPLVACDEDVWVTTMQLPVVELLTGVEAKLVCVHDWAPMEGGRSERRKARDCEWEQGYNRIIKVTPGQFSDSGRYLATLDWSEGTPPIEPAPATAICTLHVHGAIRGLPVPASGDLVPIEGRAGKLVLVGSDPLLGAWDVEKGVVLEPVVGSPWPMSGSTDDDAWVPRGPWSGTLELPLGGVVEGKLVWVDEAPGAKPVWEDGYNRVMVGNPTSTDVFLTWRTPPAAARAVPPPPKHITPARDTVPAFKKELAARLRRGGQHGPTTQVHEPKAAPKASEPEAKHNHDWKEAAAAFFAPAEGSPEPRMPSDVYGDVRERSPEASRLPQADSSSASQFALAWPRQGSPPPSTFKVDLEAGSALRAARMAAFGLQGNHVTPGTNESYTHASGGVFAGPAREYASAAQQVLPPPPELSPVAAMQQPSSMPRKPLSVARRQGVATLVHFVVPQLEVRVGQILRLVGSDPALGNWDVDSGLRLEPCEGGVWVAAVWLPAGAVIQAKLVLTSQAGPVVQTLPDGRIVASFTVNANSISLNSSHFNSASDQAPSYGPVHTWEDGDNRSFQAAVGRQNLVVCDWSDTRCALSLLDTVRCDLIVRNKVVPPGHWLAVTGTHAALGGGHPRHAPVLRWTYGNTWVGHVDLPKDVALAGLKIRLLVCSYGDGEATNLLVEEEPGDMRTIKSLDSGAVVMRAVMNWGDPAETQLYAIAAAVPTLTNPNLTLAGGSTSSSGLSCANSIVSSPFTRKGPNGARAMAGGPLMQSMPTVSETDKHLQAAMSGDARNVIASVPTTLDSVANLGRSLEDTATAPAPRNSHGNGNGNGSSSPRDGAAGNGGVPVMAGMGNGGSMTTVGEAAVAGGALSQASHLMPPEATTERRPMPGPVAQLLHYQRLAQMALREENRRKQQQQQTGTSSSSSKGTGFSGPVAFLGGSGGPGAEAYSNTDYGGSQASAGAFPGLGGAGNTGASNGSSSSNGGEINGLGQGTGVTSITGSLQPAMPSPPTRTANGSKPFKLNASALGMHSPPTISVVPEPAVSALLADSVLLGEGSDGSSWISQPDKIVGGADHGLAPAGDMPVEAGAELMSVAGGAGSVESDFGAPDLSLSATLNPGSIIIGGNADFDFELIGVDLMIDLDDFDKDV